jgi:glycosyltransferase involved in cell wall biosynthesis
MKIAQIAPLTESIPPKFYGGTERVVSYLTEELVRQGHDVTLFASGDSRTSAKLVRCTDLALRLNPAVKDPLPYQVMLLETVRKQARCFDVLHFHIDLWHFPLVRNFIDRTVTTLHGRLDLPDLKPFYTVFADIPVVSISRHQRQPMPPDVNWVGNVYNGVPTDLPFIPAPQGGYLAFLGRIAPEKRPDHAIEIAVRSGMPLRIAAKVDKVDQVYWDECIRPMIRRHRNLVEYVGEINEQQKGDFLGNAATLLFPVDWPEPFGLVVIEAMACGTPVIAFRAGSVPEIVDDGVSGFIVANVDDAVDAVSRVGTLDRAKVRAAFERRFTVERMTERYVSIYRRLSGAQTRTAASPWFREPPSLGLKERVAT